MASRRCGRRASCRQGCRRRRTRRTRLLHRRRTRCFLRKLGRSMPASPAWSDWGFPLINQLDLLNHQGAEFGPFHAANTLLETKPMNTTMKSATLAALLAVTGSALAAGEPMIGLITKTETNPFFVK